MKPRGKATSKAKAKGGKSSAKKPAKVAKPAAAKGKKASAGTTRAEAITMRCTPAATLKSLLSTCRGYKQDSDSIISKLREEIGYAVKSKHLNKGVFADLRRFDKMEAEKASEHWHTLVRYMELTGIMAKIDAVGRLPLGDDETEEGDGEAEAPGASDGGEPKVAEASTGKNGKGNGGKKKPALDPHPGIDPAAPAGGDGSNVARPEFGKGAAGISGDDLAKATGTLPH